jgi:hypothetical protein
MILQVAVLSVLIPSPTAHLGQAPHALARAAHMGSNSWHAAIMNCNHASALAALHTRHKSPLHAAQQHELTAA